MSAIDRLGYPIDDSHCLHPDCPSLPSLIFAAFLTVLNMDTSTSERKAACIIGATTVGTAGGALAAGAPGAAGGAGLGFIASTTKVVIDECKRRKHTKKNGVIISK